MLKDKYFVYSELSTHPADLAEYFLQFHLAKNLWTAKGCPTVPQIPGYGCGVGLENETHQLFFFLHEGIYEVRMSCRNPVSTTAHK